MNRTRWAISATAALAAAHLVGVALSLGDPAQIQRVHDAGGWMASIFGAFGAVVAARTFSPGEYLRRVWGLLAAGSVLLVLGHAVRSAWIHTSPEIDFQDSVLIYPRLALVAGANICTIGGLYLLAYSYTHSGLDVPRTAAFNALWAAVSALAVVLMVVQLQKEAASFDSPRHVAGGVTGMISTLADTGGLILIAPVLRIAYLMRGGRLAGVWWAVGLSEALWLIYDCRTWLVRPLPFDSAHAFALLSVVRNPALALVGLGGLLHREAVTARD
jgi:hypothetical protein